MALSDSKNSIRKPDANRPTQTRGKPAPKTEIGNALRSVYQRTVNEAVPTDLMDLLGKLD